LRYNVRAKAMSENKEKLESNKQSERGQSDIAKFFLASIIESMEDSVVSVDFNSVITSWNKGAERLYGYSAEEVIGKPLTILTLPEDLGELLANIESIKQGGIVKIYETERVHKDGHRIHLSITLSPVKDDSGQIIGVSTIARDITARRSGEASLREASQQLIDILESLTDCFFALDGEWRFTYVNSQTEAYFNISREQMLGRKLVEVLPKVKGHEILRRQQEVMARRVPVHFEVQSPVTGKWIEMHIYPTSEGLAVYFRDISNRRSAIEALRESEERLRLAIDISQISTFEIDLLTDEVQTDETGREIYGWQTDEPLTFTKVQTHFHPDDKEYVMQNVGAALEPKGAGGFEVEQRIIRTNGETRWIRVRGRAFFEGEGERRRAVRCLGTYIDITERKQAEENLRYQKTLLESLTETVLDGILIVSPEGKMLRSNQRFLDIWNFPPEVVESQSDEAALQWAAKQTADPVAFLERVNFIYGQPDHEVREEVLMKDGRVYERFGAPIRSGDTRETFGWMWTFRDITERKQAEQTRAFLAAIVESSDDAIVVVTEERKIISWNPAAEWMFGYTAEEVIGQPISIIVPEERKEELQEIDERFIKGDRSPTETVRRRKDGSLVDVSLSLSLVKDAQNNIIGISRIFRDITARKKAEAQILRQAQIINLSQEPMFIWSITGAITDWNHGSQQLYGYSKDEAVGQVSHNLLKTIFPLPLESLLSILRSEGVWKGQLHQTTKDGRKVIVESRMQMVHADGKQLILETNHDITEREKLLQREHSARLQAEEASRLKDEFLATVSHELRTPLTSILGWSQMLATGNFDEDYISRGLETIYRNAKSQAQLIEDILDVSRIITGKLRINTKPISIYPIIQAVVESLRPSIEAKNIGLRVGFDFEPRMVQADPDRVQQVVWNLLSNAIKFTPEGGRITVLLESDESETKIIVSDSGKGISPEFLPFVFDRFRQADGSTTRQHGGLGLGLAIVRHIVELHGGTVEVGSEGEGKGTTFTVRLPLPETSAANTDKSDSAAKRSISNDGEQELYQNKLKGLRVILLDDEKDTLELLAALLSQSGVEVKSQTNVRSALKAITQWKPDVIISDIAMPEEDGYSFIRKLRDLPPEDGGTIPAIALTAYVGIKDRTQVLSSGFQMYVPKPVEPTELLVTLANLVQSKD
jgi:PAS domain S-box-containing protein